MTDMVIARSMVSGLEPWQVPRASAQRWRLGRPSPGRVGLAIGLVVFLAWLALLRPASLLGGPANYVVVTGDSMEPMLHAGDLVVALTAPSYRIGDLVVYHLPRSASQFFPNDGKFPGRLIVHRIVGGDAANGYRMQGDNASHPDFWTVGAGDIAGRVDFKVPVGGRVLIFLRNPLVLGSLAAGFAFVFVVWPAPRKSTERDDHGEGSAS